MTKKEVTQPDESKIGGVDHIVLIVEDIDDGIDTWQNKIGLTLSHKVDLEGSGISQAFFSLKDGSFIELIAPAGEQSRVSRLLDRRGEGIHAIAVTVDDLDASVEQLQQNGAELIGVGTPQVFIHPRSANGVMVQLWPKTRPHRWRDLLKENS